MNGRKKSINTGGNFSVFHFFACDKCRVTFNDYICDIRKPIRSRTSAKAFAILLLRFNSVYQSAMLRKNSVAIECIHQGVSYGFHNVDWIGLD